MADHDSRTDPTRRGAVAGKVYHDRDDIAEAIRDIQVDKKGMRQFEPPTELFEMAKNFVSWASNVVKGTDQRLRFKGHEYYPLLIQDAHTKKMTTVSRGAFDLIDGWQVASKALFRYALNLYLTPKRPEFRRVKLTNSYYMYNVGGKLSNAKDILVAMGYRPVVGTSKGIQELEYLGEVDRERVITVATDLIVLHSELDLVKKLADQVMVGRAETPQLASITLEDILLVRSKDETKLGEVHQHLVKTAFQRSHQQSPPQSQYLRQSSERLQAQTTPAPDQWRRGSAPQGQIESTLPPGGLIPSQPPPVDQTRLSAPGAVPGSSQSPYGQTPQYRTQSPVPSHAHHHVEERGGRPQEPSHASPAVDQVHEMVHEKNIYHNIPPTDPPLRPIDDRVSPGHMYEQPPPQPRSVRCDLIQRGVEQSLPKGRPSAASHYTNLDQTLYNNIPGLSQAEGSEIVQLDGSEEISLPKTDMPEREGKPHQRSRTDTLETKQKVESLYRRFPQLAPKGDEGGELSDSVMYGNKEERHELETTYEEDEEGGGKEEDNEQPLSYELPPPVARTREELGRLAVEPSASSLLSMNPEIKDVHSVYDEGPFRGPNFSIMSPPQEERSPELEQGGNVDEMWEVPTTEGLSVPSNLPVYQTPPSSGLYSEPSTDDASKRAAQEEHLKSSRPSWKPPPSRQDHYVTSEKPTPVPRQRLGQRSKTMDEPERVRPKLPTKSSSGSKLVEPAGNRRVEPESTRVPTDERTKPLPSPRQKLPTAGEPRSSEVFRRANVSTASEVVGKSEEIERGKLPSSLPLNLRKHKTPQDLKSPPTVGGSKVSASVAAEETGGTGSRKPHLQGHEDLFADTFADTPGSISSPFGAKYWICADCTNLVKAPSPACDVCGGTTKTDQL